MKKIFIDEKDYNKVVMFLTRETIGYSTDKFQFDVKTAVVIFIGTAILSVIIGSL